MIHLQTVVTVPAFEFLQHHGHLLCDGRRVMHKHRAAYRWMCNHMIDRIGPPPRKNLYPLWAWVQPRADLNIRPSLGFACKLDDGVDGWLLDVSKRDNEILQSVFIEWCGVIFGHFDIPPHAVFDVPAGFSASIQATFWQLDADDVVSAVRV